MKATGTGLWTGQDNQIAYCADGAWRFYAPFAGLVAYVSDETTLIVFNGSAWVSYGSLISIENIPMLGVNTTADSTNKFVVQSNAALFSDVATTGGGTGDMRVTLSKQAAANTASFLFQDNFSGRAEIGITGDDNFHFKVSPDGSSWTDAMDIPAATGVVTLPSVDINGGTVDGAAIGSAVAATGKFTTLQASGAVTLLPASAAVSIAPTGTGTVSLSPAGALTINPAAASTINNCSIGATTASTGKFTGVTAPQLTSGAASAVTLATSGGTQFTAAHIASAVNNLQAAGSASGAGTATLSAIGTDTNIDIVLTPNGSGNVRIPTVANGTVATALSSVGPTSSHAAVQEWFAVKNASGTVRYIPAF